MKRRIVLVIVDLLVIAAWVAFWAVVAFAQRIDAGSPTDAYYSGGSTQTVAALPHDQTVRYGDFSYLVPCPDTQPRLVTFAFIEPSQRAIGARLFRVALNDQIIFDRLDLYAIAGYQVPLARRVIAHCADDWLTIRFITQARSAVVSWIDVQPFATGGGAAVPLKQVVEHHTIPAGVPAEQRELVLTLARTPAPDTVVLVFLRSSETTGDAMDANASRGTRQVTVLLPNYRPFAGDRLILVYWTLEP